MPYTRLINLFDTKCGGNAQVTLIKRKHFICIIIIDYRCGITTFCFYVAQFGVCVCVCVLKQINHLKFVLCLYYKSIVTMRYKSMVQLI